MRARFHDFNKQEEANIKSRIATKITNLKEYARQSEFHCHFSADNSPDFSIDSFRNLVESLDMSYSNPNVDDPGSPVRVIYALLIDILNLKNEIEPKEDEKQLNTNLIKEIKAIIYESKVYQRANRV